jgi:hypothetical protein
MEQGGSVSAAPAAPSGDAPAAEQKQSAEQGAESTQPKQEAAPDDPEVEVFGEKVKQSEYKRLRDLEAKRKEYDRAASLKFEEAAKLRKEAEAEKAQVKALVDGLSKDAKRALREAGVDPVKFAEQVLAEALEEHSLTPEQKELRELKAEKERREAEEAERKAKDAEAQEAAVVDQYVDDISTQFLTALKPMNLPAEDLPEIVARMAHRFEALIDSGAPIDLAAIAEDAMERHYAAPEHRFSSLSDEELLSRYPSIAERFRRALVAQTQKKPQTPSNPKPAQARAAAPKRGLTMAELRARIDQRLGA